MNEVQRHILQSRQIRIEIGKTEPVVTIPDRRYRILVTLIRSDRPRYWNFLCFNCGSKQVELQNLEVLSIDDFYDPQNINNTGIGRHCKGILPDGISCPYSYFFHVQ